MAVSFVDCRPEQLPVLQSFFARVYRPDYILAVNDDYFRWQFGDTPVSKKDDFHMRLALVDGEITGCLGYIPLEISLGGKVVTGAWLANWMVDPHTRQFGLGPLLVREISKDFEITLAAGPNKDARDLLGRMGWTDFGELPRYVAVLDTEAAGALT
ncbi:MAG: GNAT family N-acetyltransferase, partial [Chloroflexia bacterium]